MTNALRFLPVTAVCALLPAPLLGQTQEGEDARIVHLSADGVLSIAGKLIDAGRYQEADMLLARLAQDGTGGVERDFLAGMLAMARKEYSQAETLFRKILADDPNLVRVRLELARTLFLERKDEEADYHFRLAVAQHPPHAVIRNIARFREAIRARRAWRFNIMVGVAPDSNINSATSQERVEILGLPFQLDPGARRRSGTGMILGGDANLRLLRDGPVVLYLGGYGRMVRYPDHDFDDDYVGGEAGPEFRVWGGRLRLLATGFNRWYGDERLVTSLGGKIGYDKIIGGKWGIEGSLAVRHNGYARRDDLDGWDLELGLAANRAIGPSAVGFAYASVQRSLDADPGQSAWTGRFGGGVLKEIGWGLRPQLSVEVGRQVNDAPLALFGRTRRDWRFQASASIYKRDWNVAGFAPSVRLTWSRSLSTIGLYDQSRLRAEFGIAKAF